MERVVGQRREDLRRRRDPQPEPARRRLAVARHEPAVDPPRLVAGDLLLEDRGDQRLQDRAPSARSAARASAAHRLLERPGDAGRGPTGRRPGRAGPPSRSSGPGRCPGPRPAPARHRRAPRRSSVTGPVRRPRRAPGRARDLEPHRRVAGPAAVDRERPPQVVAARRRRAALPVGRWRGGRRRHARDTRALVIAPARHAGQPTVRTTDVRPRQHDVPGDPARSGLTRPGTAAHLSCEPGSSSRSRHSWPRPPWSPSRTRGSSRPERPPDDRPGHHHGRRARAAARVRGDVDPRPPTPRRGPSEGWARRRHMVEPGAPDRAHGRPRPWPARPEGRRGREELLALRPRHQLVRARGSTGRAPPAARRTRGDHGRRPPHAPVRDAGHVPQPGQRPPVTVPVIDRGPYVAGRTWDMSQAACATTSTTATRGRSSGAGRAAAEVAIGLRHWAVSDTTHRSGTSSSWADGERQDHGRWGGCRPPGLADDGLQQYVVAGLAEECHLLNMIGVMWSNQSSKRFGFRFHIDGAAPTAWSTAETAAAQSASGSMADDHLNVAVHSNGTMYVAAKTSYRQSDDGLFRAAAQRRLGQHVRRQ